MKVDELLNIFKFQHDVALKCTCTFSTFKYYNWIHQTYNGKVGLKLNLTNHFETYLLSIFIVPKFLKFYNHLIINSKKGTMLLLYYFKLFSIYFLLLLSKTRPFYDYFGDNYFFGILYHVFTLVHQHIVLKVLNATTLHLNLLLALHNRLAKIDSYPKHKGCCYHLTIKKTMPNPQTPINNGFDDYEVAFILVNGLTLPSNVRIFPLIMHVI